MPATHAATHAADAQVAPPRRKIFLGLDAMEREVRRVEVTLTTLQDEVEQIVGDLEEDPGSASAETIRELRRLRRLFEDALADRDRLIEEIHAEQSTLVQLDEAGVEDAAGDYEALDELEERLMADFGDPLAVIDAAIFDAEDVADHYGAGDAFD